MNKKIDLVRYMEFVSSVTSNESNDFEFFVNRLKSLQTENKEVNIPLLITGVKGLCSESGETMEIIKKTIFQGKPLTEENVYHISRELGDCIWYWVNTCRAIGIDPNEIISENINKLINRYPTGKFDAYYSENRKEGDL